MIERYSIRPTFNDIYWIVDEHKSAYGVTLFYVTDKGNAEIAVNYLNSQEEHLNEALVENRKLKETLVEQNKQYLELKNELKQLKHWNECFG